MEVEWSEKAGDEMQFWSCITLCQTSSEAPLTASSRNTDNPLHKVVVQLLQLSMVVNWDTLLVEGNTLGI